MVVTAAHIRESAAQFALLFGTDGLTRLSAAVGYVARCLLAIVAIISNAER